MPLWANGQHSFFAVPGSITETVCLGSWILTICWAPGPWRSLCRGNGPVPCWWSWAAASSPGALGCIQSLWRLRGGVHPWPGPQRQTGSETWSTGSIKNTLPAWGQEEDPTITTMLGLQQHYFQNLTSIFSNNQLILVYKMPENSQKCSSDVPKTQPHVLFCLTKSDN